jgi:hypothetical protein
MTHYSQIGRRILTDEQLQESSKPTHSLAQEQESLHRG